ncbi:MAG: tetratricopeptide repeat protein [Armatimonadetes bacterium]|nr:tetratricopeptide repeat protein [Armatimonadota bacterium]
MKRNEEQEVLGVPESTRSAVCPRCFADLASGAEYCPECGAPIADTGSTNASDALIYPELARVNLLRMRGDYPNAEQICLSILRRYPNNATANGLLGDINLERGELQSAIEWYELALDLTPEDEGVRQKLAQAQTRLTDQEALSTAKHLGLPTSRPKIGLYVATVLLAIVLISASAYVIGTKSAMNPRRGPATIDAPLVIEPKPSSGENGKGETSAPVPSASSFASTMTEEEHQALQEVVQRLPAEATQFRLIDMRLDPRKPKDRESAVLTAELVSDGEPEALAKVCAEAAFGAMQDLGSIGVRLIRDGKLAAYFVFRGGEGGTTLTETWPTAPPTNGSPDATGSDAAAPDSTGKQPGTEP